MDTNQRVDPEIVLQNWRTRILNGFLVIVVIIVVAMSVVTVLDALSRPGQWPAVIVYLTLTAVMIGLAVARRIDYRIRAWGTLLVPYVVGVTAMATFGLGSSGRLYMMAVPIAALILIGARPGMFMSLVSILTIVLFAVLANNGVLAETLIRDRNSLLLADWIAEFADTLGLLSIVMAVLILFYRFQESLIASERRTHAELVKAQKLLEEQNITLEQKVQERTRELQATNHSLEQRNAALGILNSVSEAMTKTLNVETIMQLVGDKIRGVFDVDTSMIMLLDQRTNLIHVPYEYDRNEGGYIDYVEPFPLGTGLSSKVISTGQPLIANTLEEETANGAYFPPEIIAKGKGAYGESWLGVPILSSDQVLGLIALADNRANVFNQNHMRLLQTLSSNLGAAIENARLFDETRRLLGETEQRNHELSIINNIQQGLASKVDLQSIIDLFGDEVSRIYPPQERIANNYSVYIALYDPQTQMIRFPYLVDGAGEHFTEHPTPLGPGLTSFIVRSGQPLVLKNAEEQLEHGVINFTQTNEAIGSQSWLGVPIRSGDQVIGVLSMQDKRPNLFTEADVRLLSTLAASLAVALENARLFAEVQQRAAELAIINSVQAGLASKLDIQAIYDLVGEKIRDTFNAQVVSIASFDRSANMIHGRFTFENGRRMPDLSLPAFGFRKYVVEHGLPLLINADMASWMEQYANPVIHGAQPKSAIFIPMLVGNEAMGVVSLQNNDRENAFSQSDIYLLTTLVNSMSVALENARLFGETQRLLDETEQRAAELATVNTVSSAITGELDVDALIRLVGEQIRAVFRTDIVYVALLDRDANIINFPYQYGQYLEPLQLGEGLTSRVIESHASLLINEDLERQREQLRAAQMGRPALSYLGVPIFVRGEAIGVVSVQSTTREGIFTENDRHLLNTIASNVGIALQNARLFDEIKHQEQVAREAAEKLRLIFENAFDGIDIYEEIPSTGQRILVECNDRYCELAGRSREELMSVENTSMFQRDIENPWEETGREAILKGEAFRGVFSWIRPDARENIIEYNAAPTKVGGRFFTIGLDRDVTERMHVENQLRESNEKLRLIFENAFDGISIYEEIPEESRRILLDCNERYCEMAGRSKEELLAIHDTRTIQHDLGVGTEVFGFAPITEGRAFSGVFSWMRPDGRENIIEYNAAPTRVGRRYFTIGLDRDVTQRRHDENELKKARAAAEQANQAKSAFLANMSHELRTPLNAIIGFTRIVRRKAEGVLPEKQTENLDKVLTSADHLLNLINTVLDIAKIEAGRMDVLAANFRIAALVDLCINTAQPLLKPTVVLERQVNESLTYVYSDQDKIRQIVLNLLSNAAKFTHAGKIVLAARQDGENLRISVSDTGIGISAEALPRIFKEFQQADNTTTRQYGGTGLGLSISRNLAHLLGGDLTVESELGQGSTFTLVIPVRYESKLAASQTNRETILAQAAVAHTEPGPVKKRVLVIDDDPDAVYLLQENLNPQEYEIVGARNGSDGLELARKGHPDAILLDIVMPGADGWHVLHDLKVDSDTCQIPVVFLTIVDKKALGLELGAAAYLLKPLDPAEVRETLNQVTNGTMYPIHILVVDDDPHVADMLRQFLPEADFHLDSALDGLAGLDAIEAHQPDILLLDLLMPRLDGFGVIEKLRADPKTSNLPIVVLSAKDLTSSEATRLKETVAGVVKKQGIEGRVLVDEINHALGQSSSGDAGREG
jgi:PAS domain S-box-containing protein